MLKKILIGLLLLLIVAVAGLYFFLNDTPPIPEGGEKAIQEALSEPLPELVKGETGYAENNGVKIWYESIAEADSIQGTVLLIMGHSGDALIWGRYFFQDLLDAGYRVIRYDNRGTGLSDRMENWSVKNAYTLEDMAEDGIAILDKLNIDQAHIVGVSMGGMIAQSMTIHHPERVKTLNSIMSSGYYFDPELPQAPTELVSLLAKITIKYLLFGDDADACRFALYIDQGLAGEAGFQFDPKYLAQRTLYNRKNRGGRNSKVGDQHTKAIELSGSRYDQLEDIKAPTLVIHGQKDPLVKIEHGKKYAAMIPAARVYWIEDMGHSIPPTVSSKVTKALLDNFKRSELVPKKEEDKSKD